MKKTVLALTFGSVLLLGCSHMVGPVAYNEDTYLMASYSKKLIVEKAKMIEKAGNFCADQGKIMKIKEIWVTDRKTSKKTAVAVVETIASALYPRVGGIEIYFNCK